MIKNSHSSSLPIALAAALFAGQTLPAQTGTGSVSGKVVTESGQPLAGVSVLYRRGQRVVADGHFHLRPAPGEPAVAGLATTKPDGTFSAGDLPPGNYALCIHNPPDLYVDPCNWNLGSVNFAITAGSNTAAKPFTIISGVRVHFLITDPQGLLPSGSRVGPAAHVGVMTPGRLYREASVSSRTGSVIDAVVTIPHNQAVNLSISSNTLRFWDSSGAVTQASAVTLAAGETDHTVSLTVTK